MPRWTLPVLVAIAFTALVTFLDIPFEGLVHGYLLRLRGPIAPATPITIVDLAVEGSVPKGSREESWAGRIAKLGDLLEQLNAAPPKAVQLDFRLSQANLKSLSERARSYPLFELKRGSSADVSPSELPIVSSPEFVDRDTFETESDPLMNGMVQLPLLRSIAPAQVRALEKSDPVLMNIVGPPGTIPRLKAGDFLAHPERLADLQGRVLLIGPPLNLGHGNFGTVPFFSRRTARKWDDTEVHANVVETVASGRWIRFPPGYVTPLLTAAVSLLTVCVLFFTAPMLGVFAIVLLTALLVFLGLASLVHGVYIDIHKGLAAILLSYYFLIPYRLILEYKGRWKYQQENRLLAEVETLKDNFMSLVSHNLKTPIARIEGIIETILEKKNAGAGEIEADLRRVLESTGDLGRFVSRILNLTRVENPEYQVRTASRDLNAVVEKQIAAHLPAAAQKKIQLTSALEPLFPIRIDEELIRESVANLIENAVRYTPEAGTVEVKTGESGDWVVLSVSDSGPGIDEHDAARIFNKFYRGVQVKNKGIKGSGLGLYLTKYFVTLHGGTIQFRNRPEGGSEFTIQLPRS